MSNHMAKLRTVIIRLLRSLPASALHAFGSGVLFPHGVAAFIEMSGIPRARQLVVKNGKIEGNRCAEGNKGSPLKTFATKYDVGSSARSALNTGCVLLGVPAVRTPCTQPRPPTRRSQSARGARPEDGVISSTVRL